MLRLKSNEIAGPGKSIKVVSRTPQTDYPEHNHDFSELILVSSGIGSHIINGELCNLLPFTISSISDKDFHQFYGNEGVNLINLIYKKDSISVSGRVADIITRFENSESQIMLPQAQFSNLMSLSNQIEAEQASSALHSDHMTSLLFETLWVNMDRAMDMYDCHGSAMEPVVYICNNFKDPLLSVAEVCEKFDITPKRLAKTILNVSGLSTAKFINSLRIREAKLLLSQQHAVTDVAMQVGFGDSNYFSTKFKSAVGCSPKDFRKIRVA